MIQAVEILANPKSEKDKADLAKEEQAELQQDCVADGCMIEQREFKAAKLIRDGKVKNANDALDYKEAE